jgi:hypothetical protein
MQALLKWAVGYMPFWAGCMASAFFISFAGFDGNIRLLTEKIDDDETALTPRVFAFRIAVKL